jgi:AcrR family transcriptional regulator
MIASVPGELPIVSLDAASERADAARNRARIMRAAAALVAERGIEHVSMQDIARAAEVGTGTVYRRFGDRAGLAYALLDDHTRRLQDALIGGAPPLGPGADPVTRLHAFGAAYLELLDRHGALILAAEPSGREGGGPYRFYLAHLTILLREAAPTLDAEYAAHTLLAGLAPGHHALLRGVLGWDLERLVDGWCRLVDALTGTPTSAAGPGRASPDAAGARAPGRPA